MGLTNRIKALLAHKEEYSRFSTTLGAGTRTHLQLLEDWKDLSNYYMSKGLPKTRAYEKVAEQYGTTRGTLIYWLTPGYREKHLAKKP